MPAYKFLNWFEKFLDRFLAGYNRVFAIDEIRDQRIVQWMFGAMLFYFFVSFEWWITRTNITIDTANAGGATCWAYFPDCTWLYFLRSLPYGYSHSTFYMGLYGIMCLIVYLMWKKDWIKAHMLMCLLLAWKIFVIFFLSFIEAGPYDYYHIFLTSILLFVPFKEYFLKLAFVVMYFMSVTVKFTEAWILGTYFTSLRLGVPLFPEWSAILLTNFVIFIQIIDSWYLMSKNWVLQRLSFAFAVIFHLYSGVLVYYNYPSVALPPVLILFGAMYTYTPTPFGRRSVAGWSIIALICLFQLLGFVVTPNRFMTLEGHRYGMFMFEANHQCQEVITTYTKRVYPEATWSGLQCGGLLCTTDSKSERQGDLTVISRRFESASAWYRCDPYELWTRARAVCDDPATVRVAMQYDHSINGGPFYRMVDEPDICGLTYNPWSHNEWIKLPPEAPLIGYPVENFYSLR